MKEWKAPEKEAQKMTRDGAVSVNLVTGETTYPSDRTPEQDHSASGDTAGAAGKVVDRVELHREQAAAKKKRRKQRRTYREGEAAAGRPSSRLQFSEADQAKPELQGAIRKSDKAADRLDAAKTAVPSKLPSPQHANPLSRPIQEAGAAIHGKVREVEQENSGVQSGHLGERSFEKAVGYGNRRVQNWRAERKLKPWRDAAKAEQAAVKANADFYYRKAVAENPQLASNPISRLWQKRKLQKQYAAAYRAAGKTAQAQENRPGVQAHRPFPETALEGRVDRGRHRSSAGNAAGLPAILFLHVRRRGVQHYGVLLSLRGCRHAGGGRSLLRQRG